MKQTENEMNVNVPLEVIKASEIEPKEVKWLWYPYIPVGKVTLLQGDPGDGKSKLMLSIAALLSKGEPLPFTETEENEPFHFFRLDFACLDNFKRYADSHFIFNHFSLFSFSINISGKAPQYSGNSAYSHSCIFCKVRCR